MVVELGDGCIRRLAPTKLLTIMDEGAKEGSGEDYRWDVVIVESIDNEYLLVYPAFVYEPPRAS